MMKSEQRKTSDIHPPNQVEYTTAKLSKLFDLTDRVAVVTGGAGLLGEEFCCTLVQAGAKVVIADINISAAEKLAERIKSFSYQPPLAKPEQPNKDLPSSLVVGTDVTKPDSVQNMVSTTLQVYGRLDILVNSAALDPKFDHNHTPLNIIKSKTVYQDSNAFENFSHDLWNRALDINLTGVFLCCQAAIKPMLEQDYGVIVNLSSIYGLVAPDQRMYQQPDKPPQYKPVYYSVTKFGIIGLTKYLAAYYAGKNIRVNAISPGGVFNSHDDDFAKAYAARSVIGRMAEKDEINGALLFLVSDASRYMTGANLVIDGGWTTW